MIGVAAVVAAMFAATTNAQRRSRGFGGYIRSPTPQSFDGAFNFCRVMFSYGNMGDGGGWLVDYPRADVNLSIRLSELTKARISLDSSGEPNHVVLRLTDPELFQCPFIMMTEVGSLYFAPEDANQLREYLLKGGFLWADDFWGSEAWEWWEAIMKEVLPPPEYAIVDLTPGHPLFHAQFVVKQVPQIANIFHWSTFGDGRERGSDSPQANARAILDSHGRIMVLMTHNTDFGDSFEREGDDPAYFLDNSVPGYAFGINTLLYAMTH